MKSKFDLEGKVAIVTGARRGMGASHSSVLAGAGARVVVVDIDKAECEKVVGKIREDGGEAFALECDITKKEEVSVMIEKTEEKYGGLDILVNNAGINDFKNFFEMATEDWDRIINVNLKGAFFCTQAGSRLMKESGGGSIINIGSVAMGQGGIGFPRSLAYVSSKGGLAGMTEALAIDLASSDIRVNLIAPGIIETPMIDKIKEDKDKFEEIIDSLPMKRIGKPEEVSAVVHFLASEASSYMTGAIINVDGGWLSR